VLHFWRIFRALEHHVLEKMSKPLRLRLKTKSNLVVDTHCDTEQSSLVRPRAESVSKSLCSIGICNGFTRFAL